MSERRKLTVCVCGGIAAYRAVELVRLLQTAGFDPHVAMTAAAQQFVAPLTFAAISGHRVLTTLWTGTEVPQGDSSIEHIGEAQTTQALVIVPATADILAKLAHGFADDFLTTLYLATPAPVVIAPAMNVVMWNHPAVQANLATLRARGNLIVEPAFGHLACGMEGAGRLAPLESIVATVQKALAPIQQDLAHETVLITAGGTREPIDAVRFLGNRSSGRMGYALAQEALARGARVLLISANCALPVPHGTELIPVSTAAEMRSAVLSHLPRTTMLLKAAAVADFRPTQPFAGKHHRSGSLTLALEPTEDIVAEAVAHRLPGTLIIAFAAELPEPIETVRAPHVSPSGHGMEDVPRNAMIARARAKLLRKGVDAIVLNDVSLPGLGFDSESNAGTFITPEDAIEIAPTSKRAMAASILDRVVLLRNLSRVPVQA